MTRLTIEISEQQHQSIKALAALNGQSIKDYALHRLFSNDEEQAWKELQLLLSERIAQAENGGISTRTFEQIAEEEMRAISSI